MYESDLTRFMRDLFHKNPQLADAQKEARAIWWDKKVDFDELKRTQESRVPIRGYVYYPLISPAANAPPADPKTSTARGS
jgi:Protein of unknown function (DUF3460)